MMENSHIFKTDDSFFSCGFCGVKYKEEASFLDHVKNHHRGSKQNLSTVGVENSVNETVKNRQDSGFLSNINEVDVQVEKNDECSQHGVDEETQQNRLDVENGVYEVIVRSDHCDQDENNREIIDAAAVEYSSSNIAINSSVFVQDSGTSQKDGEKHKINAIISPQNKTSPPTIHDLNMGKVVKRIFHCSYCYLQFNDSDKFNSHLERHGQTFSGVAKSSKGKPSYQEKRSNTKRPKKSAAAFLYQCGVCSYSTHIKNSMNRHLSIHSSVKKWSCPYCQYRGADWTYLKKHVRGRHSHLYGEFMADRSLGPGKYSRNLPDDMSEKYPSFSSKPRLKNLSNEKSFVLTISPSRANHQAETDIEFTPKNSESSGAIQENVDLGQQPDQDSDNELNCDETFACSYCQFTIDSSAKMWKHLEVQHAVRRDEN